MVTWFICSYVFVFAILSLNLCRYTSTCIVIVYNRLSDGYIVLYILCRLLLETDMATDHSLQVFAYRNLNYLLRPVPSVQLTQVFCLNGTSKTSIQWRLFINFNLSLTTFQIMCPKI